MVDENFRKQVDDALLAIRAEARSRPVVLVFGMGSYGDVLQITPLLRALQARFPETGLVLVHHDPAAVKLLASAPYVARTIRLGLGCHQMLRSRMAERDYDLMVECRYVIKYTLSRETRLGKVGRHFVESAQEGQKPWLKYVQNFPFDNDLLWRAAHARGWSMYDLMAQTSGFADHDFEAFELELPVEQALPAKWNLPDSYVVVSNSAEWLTLQSSLWTKCLPHEKMNAVLRQLKSAGIPTVLLGTNNDPGAYEVDANLRGETNLGEAALILKKARLVLGPEGGLVNLARAVGVPSVVFFGSTPPEFFGLKGNINIAPRVCGGCWWTTESYLRQCPLLETVPPCTNSLDAERIVAGVRELYFRQP